MDIDLGSFLPVEHGLTLVPKFSQCGHEEVTDLLMLLPFPHLQNSEKISQNVLVANNRNDSG